MRRLNDLNHTLVLTGYCLWLYRDNDQPFLVRIEDDLFLPLFSTKELAESDRAARPLLAQLRLKQITDGLDFLSSVRGKVRVIVDPWVTPEGNTRFLEVQS